MGHVELSLAIYGVTVYRTFLVYENISLIPRLPNLSRACIEKIREPGNKAMKIL